MTNNDMVNAIWARYIIILHELVKTCGVFKGIEETAVDDVSRFYGVSPKAVIAALDEAALRADFEDFEE